VALIRGMLFDVWSGKESGSKNVSYTKSMILLNIKLLSGLRY
jgi:hypothetical protein